MGTLNAGYGTIAERNLFGDVMATEEVSKEERILRMVKRVLTDIAKETYTEPGLKHPLSEKTILNIRDCFALIAAREAELAATAGRPMDMRPRFADEPEDKVVVPISKIGRLKKDEDEPDRR